MSPGDAWSFGRESGSDTMGECECKLLGLKEMLMDGSSEGAGGSSEAA